MTAAPVEVQFTEKYRPQSLSEVFGQEHVTGPLRAFVQRPYPCAMLFSGDTGTGKTSAALALVNDLGIDHASNFFHIKSGAMDGENTEDIIRTLRFTPWGGGWRLILVDEADQWTPKARQLWLSALEQLPSRTVIVFTTNHAEKFDQRTLDRFTHFRFQAGGESAEEAAQRLIDGIWHAETGGTDGPELTTLPDVLRDGVVSFRRVVSTMQSLIRFGLRPVCGGSPPVEDNPPLGFSGSEETPVNQFRGAPKLIETGQDEAPAPKPKRKRRSPAEVAAERRAANVAIALANGMLAVDPDDLRPGDRVALIDDKRAELYTVEFSEGSLIDLMRLNRRLKCDRDDATFWSYCVRFPRPEPTPPPDPSEDRVMPGEDEGAAPEPEPLDPPPGVFGEPDGPSWEPGIPADAPDWLKAEWTEIDRRTAESFNRALAAGQVKATDARVKVGDVVTFHWNGEGTRHVVTGFGEDKAAWGRESCTADKPILLGLGDGCWTMDPSGPTPGPEGDTPSEVSGDEDDRTGRASRVDAHLLPRANPGRPGIRPALPSPLGEHEPRLRATHRGCAPEPDGDPGGRDADLTPSPGFSGMPVQAPRMPRDRRSDLIDVFLAGRKPTTLRAYQGDLRDFAAFTGHEDPARCAAWLFSLDVGDANHAALRYRNAMAELGLSPATIERRLSMLKALSKMARMVGACSWTLEVEAPKVARYRDTAGPGDGWHAILERARADTSPRGFRDVAILLTLHDLALRRAELVNLDLADVEMGPEGPAALWVLGKGRSDKGRFTLPRRTADALKRWIAIRGPAEGPLFVRMDAGADLDTRGIPRMHVNSVYKLVGASGVKAGLERRVRPHGLRHRAITAALDATRGDVRAVARFSRHSSLDTLQKYDDNRRDLGGQVAAMVAGEG